MSLDARYGPSDIRSVLNEAFSPSVSRKTYGGIRVPGHYYNENAIVLDTATDTKSSAQQLQTIEEAFDSIVNLPFSARTRKILIPVAEEQNMFLFFPRNHWVTLCYDPNTNSATLLDSRPWYISFFYPTSAMEDSLKRGLAKLYDSNTVAQMRFETVYQGVQHNDIHCGAWTTTNIRDLASAGGTIDNQKDAYTSDDESTIVANNQQRVAPNSNAVVKKPSFFEQLYLLIWPIKENNIEPEPQNEDINHSWVGMNKALVNKNDVKKQRIEKTNTLQKTSNPTHATKIDNEVDDWASQNDDTDHSMKI